MYSGDGRGNWWRTEWSEQCPEKVFLSGRCQGVKGHKGIHWCYGADGSFDWEDNDDDHKHDGASGSTPPDHKSYKTPQLMAKCHFMRFKKTAKVTDKAIIAKLEKGKTPENYASLNRPIDWSKETPEFKKMIEGRLAYFNKKVKGRKNDKK